MGPARLLDIGPHAASQYLRLIETIDPHAPYIALSYRWGKQENFVTPRVNLSKMMARIDMEDMPRTFRHAIQITRLLDVRYIWVDALCIIQNDIENTDWKIESMKMAPIYQGSLFTIPVICCSDVNQGFLGSQTHAANPMKAPDGGLPFCTIPWSNSAGFRFWFFVRERSCHSAILSEDGDPDGYLLLCRGWMFQQRLLSTRSLHLLPQELLWECKCDYWCECTSVT